MENDEKVKIEADPGYAVLVQATSRITTPGVAGQAMRRLLGCHPGLPRTEFVQNSYARIGNASIALRSHVDS